jgi:hypothetical protein
MTLIVFIAPMVVTTGIMTVSILPMLSKVIIRSQLSIFHGPPSKFKVMLLSALDAPIYLAGPPLDLDTEAAAFVATSNLSRMVLRLASKERCQNGQEVSNLES